MVVLADHNIVGQARLLFGVLGVLGWVDLLDLRLTTFDEIGLSSESIDRDVWWRAQGLGMFLLTDNRNKEGPDSLEQTLLEETTSTSIPVLTVGSAERLRRDHACAERVAEILVDMDHYLGASRIYIP